jgi:lysophospholipase L1-like esterase
MDASAQNIIVAAGVNDIIKETPLGTVGDTTTATFYGAMYVLLTGLLGRYPGKRILWITPINYGEAATEEPYINAILTMCGRFAVPVVDMWHNGGPVSAVTEALSNLNTTDGLHFTTSAHAAIARRVAAMLQTM